MAYEKAHEIDAETRPYVPSGEGLRRLREAIGVSAAKPPAATTGPLPAAILPFDTPGSGVTASDGNDNEHYRRIDPAFLLRDDDDEREPLIRGVLYPGLITTVSSWVGVGKTTLALSLIIALIRGQKALGLLQTSPLTGPVVYLTEQGDFSFRRTYRRTLNAHEMESADFLRHTAIYGLEQYSILDPAVRESFAEATREAVLIVVDTFDEWLSADPNKTENALMAFRVLREAADRGTAVLILDHQGKSNAHQNRQQSSVAGSSAKQRPGDMVYRLDTVDGPDPYNLLESVKDRHGDAIRVELRRDEEGRLIALRVDKTQATQGKRVGKAAECIVSLLQRHGTMTWTALIAEGIEAGHKRGTLRLALDWLLDAETVKKPEGQRGVYALPPV